MNLFVVPSNIFTECASPICLRGGSTSFLWTMWIMIGVSGVSRISQKGDQRGGGKPSHPCYRVAAQR